MNWVLPTTALAAGLWLLRAAVHRAILWGLRAPRVPHALDAAGLGLPASQVHTLSLPGRGGARLHALWLPATPAAQMHTPAPAVLVMHGWGANAEMMAPVVAPLHAAGWGVLLLDARCHGRSDDARFSSLPRFAEDLADGLTWLRKQAAVDAQRLALLGHSVGAAAALLHAAEHGGVRAVVSLSAFAHPQEVMRRWLADHHLPYPVLGWYVLRRVQRVIGRRFSAIAPLTTLPQLRCPVLLVHGEDDQTVPLRDAERLHAVAPPGSALLRVPGDHDLRAHWDPLADAVVAFLRGAVPLR